jgi:hypothetical protein
VEGHSLRVLTRRLDVCLPDEGQRLLRGDVEAQTRSGGFAPRTPSPSLAGRFEPHNALNIRALAARARQMIGPRVIAV